MAAPTITAIAPARIHTGGQLVTVTGGGFRLPDDPLPMDGPAPPPAPTVSVLIAGQLAANVRIYSEGELTFQAPAHDPGAADVTIANLDQAGAVIAGESTTAVGALTYALADLTDEADLTRVTRTLLRELKRQVLPNTLTSESLDFDPGSLTQLDVSAIAHLPALVISGPSLSRNRFLAADLRPITLSPATEPIRFERRATPETMDLTYRVIGLDDHTQRLSNLLALVIEFARANRELAVPRTSAAQAERVAYELDWTSDIGIVSTPNESNVRAFSGSVTVRGFELQGIASFAEQGIVERGKIAQSMQVAVNLPRTRL